MSAQFKTMREKASGNMGHLYSRTQQIAYLTRSHWTPMFRGEVPTLVRPTRPAEPSGVGRWTAEYVLLRGLGRLDIFS